MMGDRTPETTLLRQKPAAAEGRMAKSIPTLDDLSERMAALLRDLPKDSQATAPPPRPGSR
jgi:hypothetical protein